MTEEDKKFDIKNATEYIYDSGFSSACTSIIEAIKLIPVDIISKEHIIKLIGIVQRIHKEKK